MVHGSSCPCKKLTVHLSTITAAEYGDIHTLIARAVGCNSDGSSLALRQDSAGNTPLHIAAQHGHVAVVAWLLGSTGKGSSEDCSTISSSSIVNAAAGGATPLHRACFSGATGAMGLLLNVPACDVLAKDTSFGDLQTPLHKAASGGRVLAVQLMLEALQQRSEEQSSSSSSSSSTPTLLETAITVTDAMGRTPLQVAQEKLQNQDLERESVARWDTVANGKADWAKCVELLEQAQSKSGAAHSQRSAWSGMKHVPNQMPYDGLCNDVECRDNQDGASCITSSWERAFREALWNNANAQAAETKERTPDEKVDALVAATKASPTTDSTEASTLCSAPQRPIDDPLVGRPCHECGVRKVVLYSWGDKLVCKGCRRRKR